MKDIMTFEEFKNRNCIQLDEQAGQAYVAGMATVNLDSWYLEKIEKAMNTHNAEDGFNALMDIEAMLEFDNDLWEQLYSSYTEERGQA